MTTPDLNIVYKDITRPKLTFAVDRAELKIPNGYPDDEAASLTKFARQCHQAYYAAPEKVSMRGRPQQRGAPKSWYCHMYNGQYANKSKVLVEFRETPIVVAGIEKLRCMCGERTCRHCDAKTGPSCSGTQTHCPACGCPFALPLNSGISSIATLEVAGTPEKH